MSRFLPSVVFLMEVKLKRNKKKLIFEGLFYVERVNNEGGLVLLWKDKNMVSLLGYSKFFIDVAIRIDVETNWRQTGFYGIPD